MTRISRDEAREKAARAVAALQFDLLGEQWFTEDKRHPYIEKTWRDNLPIVDAVFDALSNYEVEAK